MGRKSCSVPPCTSFFFPCLVHYGKSFILYCNIIFSRADQVSAVLCAASILFCWGGRALELLFRLFMEAVECQQDQSWKLKKDNIFYLIHKYRTEFSPTSKLQNDLFKWILIHDRSASNSTSFIKETIEKRSHQALQQKPVDKKQRHREPRRYKGSLCPRSQIDFLFFFFSSSTTTTSEEAKLCQSPSYPSSFSPT